MARAWVARRVMIRNHGKHAKFLLAFFSIAFFGCVAVDQSGRKSTSLGLITTPSNYYSTPKGRYLGEKYNEKLSRLVDQIVRNPTTAKLQFANNISSVGGIGFFTHSAAKTPDERYLEVILGAPEVFDAEGEFSSKVNRLFSLYGTELLSILSSDAEIFNEKEVAGYGLNFSWRNTANAQGGPRVTLERAIIYLPKDKVREFLRQAVTPNALLGGAVIFAMGESGPTKLVSFRPQEPKPDFRPPIQEQTLAGDRTAPRVESQPPATAPLSPPTLRAAEPEESSERVARETPPAKQAVPVAAMPSPSEKKTEVGVGAEGDKDSRPASPPAVARLPESAISPRGEIQERVSPRENPVGSVARAPSDEKRVESIPLVPEAEVKPSDNPSAPAPVAQALREEQPPNIQPNEQALKEKTPGPALSRPPPDMKAEPQVTVPKVQMEAPVIVAPARTPTLPVKTNEPAKKKAEESSVPEKIARVPSVAPPAVPKMEAPSSLPKSELKAEPPPAPVKSAVEKADAPPRTELSPAPKKTEESPAVVSGSSMKSESGSMIAKFEAQSSAPPVAARPIGEARELTPAPVRDVKPQSPVPAEQKARETATKLPPAQKASEPASESAPKAERKAPESPPMAAVPEQKATPQKAIAEKSQEQLALIEKPSLPSTPKIETKPMLASRPPPPENKTETVPPPTTPKIDVEPAVAIPPRPAEPKTGSMPSAAMPQIESKPSVSVPPSPESVESPRREKSAPEQGEQLALKRKPAVVVPERKAVLPKPAVRSLGGYIVQLSFADKDSAQREAAKLEREGFVISLTAAGSGSLRLRVGNFSTHDDAARQLKKLQAEGLRGIVLSLPEDYRPEIRPSSVEEAREKVAKTPATSLVIPPASSPIEAPIKLTGPYVIQLSFAESNQARDWAQQLAQQGHSVAMSSAAGGREVRLRVGNFSTRDEASQELRKLRSRGASGLVLRVSTGN